MPFVCFCPVLLNLTIYLFGREGPTNNSNAEEQRAGGWPHGVGQVRDITLLHGQSGKGTHT